MQPENDIILQKTDTNGITDGCANGTFYARPESNFLENINCCNYKPSDISVPFDPADPNYFFRVCNDWYETGQCSLYNLSGLCPPHIINSICHETLDESMHRVTFSLSDHKL